MANLVISLQNSYLKLSYKPTFSIIYIEELQKNFASVPFLHLLIFLWCTFITSSILDFNE